MASDPRSPSRSAAGDALARGRPAVSRSFRLHRPRGAFCGRGYCGLCEIETERGRGLACLVAAGEARRLRLDPLRAAGFVGERLPPWFYERAALRHAPALHLLRRLTAAAPLPEPADARAPKAWRAERLETAVVGSGGNVAGAVVGVYPGKILGVVREDALVEMSFERLVLDTGCYDAPPPIPGNDLPGVIGLGALEAYAAESAIRGARIAVWGAADRARRAREVAEAEGATVVWEDERAPRRILGRRRVAGIDAGGQFPCDLVVSAVAQPALELAAQAGARLALSETGLPVLVAAETPEWLRLEGPACARESGVPDVPVADGAFACLCEDVRARDVRRAIADGFDVPELVKRRTGALTGPCQGRLCAARVLSLLREAGRPHEPTTVRPPLAPVSLRELAADA